MLLQKVDEKNYSTIWAAKKDLILIAGFSIELDSS